MFSETFGVTSVYASLTFSPHKVDADEGTFGKSSKLLTLCKPSVRLVPRDQGERRKNSLARAPQRSFIHAQSHLNPVFKEKPLKAAPLQSQTLLFMTEDLFWLFKRWLS